LEEVVPNRIRADESVEEGIGRLHERAVIEAVALAAFRSIVGATQKKLRKVDKGMDFLIMEELVFVVANDKAVEEAIEVKKETGKDEEEKGGFGGKMRKHEFSQVEEVGFR